MARLATRETGGHTQSPHKSRGKRREREEERGDAGQAGVSRGREFKYHLQLSLSMHELRLPAGRKINRARYVGITVCV